MTDLLRVDLKRVMKDKLFLIMLILAAAFAVFTPLLYWAISFAVDEELLTMLAGDLLTVKTQFFSSFALSNNLGLVFPVLLPIVLCKDFSHGTVRNKIISGHARWKIFLSLFTVCAVVLFGMILLHGLMTMGVSFLFYDYQATPVEAGDIAYFFQSLLLEFLSYLFVAAFLSCLCVSTKNVGIAMVLYVAVMFGMTMISGVVALAAMALSMEPDKEALVKLLEFLQDINVFYYSGAIGLGTEYTARQLLCYIGSSLIGTVAALGLGFAKFNKKDLK